MTGLSTMLRRPSVMPAAALALLALATPARANLVFNSRFETLNGETTSFAINWSNS
jgi:hypothetical protein